MYNYASHTDKVIKGFFGDYSFLCNFYETPVTFQGRVYKSSEAAYQSCKVIAEDRDVFCDISPALSKKIWKLLRPAYTPEHFNNIKVDLMRSILLRKFTEGSTLAARLIETGDRYLEETNHWGDAFWGFDVNKGHGENHLGKILMQIREVLK